VCQVVDADGKLVGIVSGFTQDEPTQKWYNSPCSSDYLRRLSVIFNPDCSLEIRKFVDDKISVDNLRS